MNLLLVWDLKELLVVDIVSQAHAHIIHNGIVCSGQQEDGLDNALQKTDADEHESGREEVACFEGVKDETAPK